MKTFLRIGAVYTAAAALAWVLVGAGPMESVSAPGARIFNLSPGQGLFLPLVQSAHAQTNNQLNNYLSGSPVTRGIGAVSTDVSMLVRYTGTSASGTVAVDAATGDLTFLSGASGSEAADTSFECPVSGALGGIIDVSNAACNTFGEVVDTINGLCTGCIRNNWTAVLVGAMRSESTDNTNITLSATTANAPEGLGLLFDGVVTFRTSIALTQYQNLTSYVSDNRYRLVENPFAGQQAVLHQVTATSTYGSGTSDHVVYCVALVNSRTNPTETVTSYRRPAGATTVASTLDFPYGLSCPTGQKMIVRTDNSAAMSASTLYAAGRVWRPTP